MTPTNYIQTSLQAILANTPGLLGELAPFTKVHLAKAAFTPALGLLWADMNAIQADYAGYVPISCGQQLQIRNVDPVTGALFVTLYPPLGGFTFFPSGVLATPQTIFGIYITDSADAVLYASELLPTPQTLLSNFTPLILDSIDFEFPVQFIN